MFNMLYSVWRNFSWLGLFQLELSMGPLGNTGLDVLSNWLDNFGGDVSQFDQYDYLFGWFWWDICLVDIFKTICL